MPVVERSVLLPHARDLVYAVVNDVAAYPEFLPACESVTVISASADALVATIDVQAKGIRQSFTTRNTMRQPELITLNLENGPFEYLTGQWQFKDLSTTEQVGCRVTLHLEYEITRMLRPLLAPLLDRAADRFVAAFCTRVADIGGH